METFELLRLEISHADWKRSLYFAKAELIRLTEMGSRLWYLDIDGLQEMDLLHYFSRSENIKVDITANTVCGQTFSGTGYFHPNTAHPSAAIRGDGVLTKVA